MKTIILFLLFFLLGTQFCYANFLFFGSNLSISYGEDESLLNQQLESAIVPMPFWLGSWSYFIAGVVFGLLIPILAQFRAMHNRRFFSHGKSVLMADVRHDVRTSLAIIQKMLEEVVSEDLPEPVTAKVNYTLRYINDVMKYCQYAVPFDTVKVDMYQHSIHAVRLGLPFRDSIGLVEGLPVRGNLMLEGNTEMVYSDVNSTRGRGTSGTDDDACFINKMEMYLERHLSEEKYTVLKLSMDMGMCRTRFCDRLKQISGKTPSKYILDFKIEKAKKLLVTRKYTVTEIATMVGFCDAKYFGRVFKAHTDVSPTMYVEEQVLKGVIKGRVGGPVPLTAKTELKSFFL